MGDFFMSPAELKTLLETPTRARILDVRKRPAFEASGEMIPGAEWRDPFEIDAWMGALDKDMPLVIHCVHGHEVSQNAAKALREAGFEARVLDGGIEGWREAGGAVVPASGDTGATP